MKQLMLVITLCGLVFAGSNYIPKGYYDYNEILYSELNRLMPGFDTPPVFGSTIEQESCIWLKHSKCWNPKSRLKTKREEGAGLPQLTRAYRPDGTLRFDTLTELSRRYPSELSELNWNNVYDRGDLQIKGMILLYRSNYKKFESKIPDFYDVLAFSDAAYNGGYRGVYKDMQLCKMTKGCDHKVWFDNVENTCTKSKRILYGNRNACDINREHVSNVLKVRFEKYIMKWYDEGFYMKYPP